jgi:hypothetical protein
MKSTVFRKILPVLGLAALVSGCAQHDEGFSGPSMNMQEDVYRSDIDKSKDKPGVEREARVDFFKAKTKF